MSWGARSSARRGRVILGRGAFRLRELLGELRDRDWIFALSLSFFVAVCVWFAMSVHAFVVPSTGDILLPAFTGQTADDANAECEQLRLTCTVLVRQPSSQYPSDVVMGQQPEAGAHVRQGRAIGFILSSGVQIFPMPDLRFDSLRSATLEIARHKLHLAGTTTVADDDVPANHVLSQNPAPLTSVHEGIAVSLVLSRGPPSSVVVPTFIDLNLDEARDRAERAHVHLGQVVWTPFGLGGPPRGTVVRQSPQAGRYIDPFAPVSLQVSAGPTEYGYLVRQVHATVAIPPDYDVAHVRIEVRDQTGEWNLFDGSALGGQKLDFDLTAVGTAQVDTYIDDELQNATTIGVEPPGMPPVPKVPPEKGPRP